MKLLNEMVYLLNMEELCSTFLLSFVTVNVGILSDALSYL